MSNSKNSVVLMLMLSFFISCEKENVPNDGLIDDSERKIMIECSENLLASKEEVEHNLIGRWKLIGHGTTNFQERPQPSIHLTISTIDLIIEFQNEEVERVDTLSWEIEEIHSLAGQSFRLNTSPQNTALLIHQFCGSYMYGETSPINDGGNMFLYQKVE